MRTLQPGCCRRIAIAALLGAMTMGTGVAAFAQDAQPANADPAPPTAAEVNSDYRIGPGDTLNVFVFNHPELSMPIPVRPDGKVSMPLVEDMPAAGKTSNQLARDLEVRLSEYLRAPKVSIMVTGFVGGDQVRVIGQAAQPKSVPYRANMTLLDLMIEVGGLAEFAAGNRAKIVRVNDGKQTELRVKLKDLVQKGDMRANVTLQPGDVIIIPESRF
jgi:polysaccharide export outer membrane protein